MNKIFAEKFVKQLGQFMDKIPFRPSIKDEGALEIAMLPKVKEFIQKELTGNTSLDHILYHHGKNKKDKRLWRESKDHQTVTLYGSNVADMFIRHEKIGRVSIELKYAKLSKKGEGLTPHIQRAIGQSLIARLKHPYAICFIVYKKQKKHLEKIDKISLEYYKKLHNLLWRKHRIYFIIRKQAI